MYILNHNTSINSSYEVYKENVSLPIFKRFPNVKINTQPNQRINEQQQKLVIKKQTNSAEKKDKNNLKPEKRKISLSSPTKNSVGKLRKYTEQINSPMTNKLFLIKKCSEQSPVMQFQKTCIKFHKIFDNLPKLKDSKKYDHFCQRSRYFQVVRKPLQQTIQKLSAESWVAFDYSQQKYIKGWKNKQSKCVNNLNKVLIMNTLLKIFQKDQSKRMERIIIRIQKLQSDNHQVFQNHTKISVKELLFGLMLTSSQEITDYLYINMGYYILVSQNNSEDIWIDSETNLEKQIFEIFIENRSNNKHFKAIFENEMKKILEQLQLNNSFIKGNEFYSCAMDLCILFHDCLSYPLFREIISSKSRISNIRFQVGYNYWEARKIKWHNQFRWPEEYFGICIGFKGNGNSVLAYNKKHEILIILVQGRYFKTLSDLQNIKNWCLQSQKVYNPKQSIQS